jgi:organic hydroperoxide reductase OsmC/OhrA
MSVFTIHRYGVRTEWSEGAEVALSAPGKPVLDIALPSDFKNRAPGVWSPEELLIASLATCFELTMIAEAEHRNVPLHDVRVDSDGPCRTEEASRQADPARAGRPRRD